MTTTHPATAARIRASGRSRSVYSPGWGCDVVLGSGQARVLDVLEEAARRNPRSQWHAAPPMRAYGYAPAVARRHLYRLRDLGVIAIEATARVGVRFTFRGRRWKWTAPVRRTLTLARMKLRDVRAGIAAFFAGRQPVQVPLPLTPGPAAGAGILRPAGPSLKERLAGYGFPGFAR